MNYYILDLRVIATIKSSIEYNKNYFPKLKDPKFSLLFYQFVCHYYSTKERVVLRFILARLLDIYYIIEYLHDHLNLSFEVIKFMKQKGTSLFLYKGRAYKIEFKSETELYVNGKLIFKHVRSTYKSKYL